MKCSYLVKKKHAHDEQYKSQKTKIFMVPAMLK